MNHPYLTNPAARLSRCRDLTLLDVNEAQYLVVACDSDGGIGSKPQDIVKVSDELVGIFGVRVPLFEIIACGAEPFLVVDCLSVEMDGTGARILEAIKAYARLAGIEDDAQFTGSTEDNVPTVQTGIGVTVLGMADKQRFFPGSSKAGDSVVCAGIPKSGPRHRLTREDPEVLSIEDLMELRSLSCVRDVLPVGSKGVLREAHQLGASASLTFVPNADAGIDLRQSAGPSTCVVLSVAREDARRVLAAVAAPTREIGVLEGGGGSI